MNRVVILLLASVWLICTAEQLGAANRGVQIRPGGADVFNTTPKKLITATFAVTNTSDEPLDFMPRVELPDGWKLITPSFPFRLAPGGREIRLVSFFVPRAAAAGKYEVIWHIRSEKYAAVSDIARILVAVQSVTGLQVNLLKAPDRVIAGDAYNAVFSVISQSNTTQKVILKIQSSHNLAGTVSPEALSLAPGESATVTATVKTDETIQKGMTHLLTLSARSQGDETIKSQAKSAVKIISRISGKLDPSHRIPAELTVKAIGWNNEGKSGMFQGQFSGQGPLDEEGTREIDFLFRRPDASRSYSNFGEEEHYSASFRSKNASIGIGDDYFALSHLTEQSIRGRGLKGKLKTGEFEFNTYHMISWPSDQDKRETAFQLAYPFGDDNRVGLSFLNKKNDTKDNQIASLYGSFSPFEKSDLAFEAAYGGNNSETAYWMDFDSLSSWGGLFSLEYLRAAPDFAGYYSDKEYISGNFLFPITKGFSLNTLLRQEKNNLDLNPDLESAALSRLAELALNFQFKTGTSLSLESRVRTRKDRLAAPDFDDRVAGFKTRLGHSFEKLSLNVSVEPEKIKNNLDASSSDGVVYEGAFYFRPTRAQSYGGYMRYSTSGGEDSEDQKVLDTGITASIQFSENVRLNAKLDRRQTRETHVGNRHSFDLGLSYIFSDKSRIEAFGNRTFQGHGSGLQNETAFMLSYTIPFGIPVGRKKSIGAIEGLVCDQETGQGISNVILQLNGASAVTDSRGNFTFPALKPGTFYLDIDRGSIGYGRIPSRKTTFTVDIAGGKTHQVRIEITKSAAVQGQIMRYEFAGKNNVTKSFNIVGTHKNAAGKNGSGKFQEVGGFANVMLELKSETETLRVMSDLQGRFMFEDLRPGNWVLTVDAANLPEHHYLEKNRIEIEVKPGALRQMQIRVLPRKRVIRMIDQGAILVEEE